VSSLQDLSNEMVGYALTHPRTESSGTRGLVDFQRDVQVGKFRLRITLTFEARQNLPGPVWCCGICIMQGPATVPTAEWSRVHRKLALRLAMTVLGNVGVRGIDNEQVIPMNFGMSYVRPAGAQDMAFMAEVIEARRAVH